MIFYVKSFIVFFLGIRNIISLLLTTLQCHTCSFPLTEWHILILSLLISAYLTTMIKFMGITRTVQKMLDVIDCSCREATSNELFERRENTKLFPLCKCHEDVLTGPYPWGAPFEAEEKLSIVNLCKSYFNIGTSSKDKKEETSQRLQFGQDAISYTVKKCSQKRCEEQ